MGANKNSDRHICGNVLINIKSIKNKNKVFTFHCAFCNTDCDQLKKFSKHLEEEHLQCFENTLDDIEEQIKCPIMTFEQEEIKVEEDLVENINAGDKTNFSNTTCLKIYKDPLGTEKSRKNELQALCSLEKSSKTNSCNIVPCNINIIQGQNEISEQYDQTAGGPRTAMFKGFSSVELSDDSSDTDFEVDNLFKTKNSSMNSKKETNFMKLSNTDIKKTTSKNTGDVTLSNKKPKIRRRIILEKILPILIQQYKKYEILWQTNNIAFGVKNKKYEIYSKIIEELKLNHDINISLEDINYHFNYLNELYSKDKEQELKCRMEKMEFLPEYKLYKDMSFLSDSQGPFLCTICNEIVPKYDPYCHHMAQHKGTQPFKCPSCEMMFSTYHKYLIHKKRHLGINNFHCDICGKGYLFKNDLEWHITSHTGDKPYLCQICGTGFRARHGYDNHVRRHEARFRHECHICKRGFNQLHALNNHVKSHLNIRDVICKICGKGFVHNKYLKRHQLIHGEVKNYKCNECGKAFFQACGLRAHRKNHHS